MHGDDADEEDLDEVLEHQKLDAFLRKAYAHSDKYMRAMNSMCGKVSWRRSHRRSLFAIMQDAQQAYTTHTHIQRTHI